MIIKASNNAQKKRERLLPFFISKAKQFIQLIYLTYLFITYIVTSKPKRISVAVGVVHMINIL